MTLKISEIYPVIYKRTTTGDVQEWHVERQNDQYRSVTGKRGGKMVTAAWTSCEAKNVGKANEINSTQQAHNEVLAMYKKKLRKDFKEDLANIDMSTRFNPMLADPFGKHEERIPEEETLYFQPKLDGFRCVANAQGLWTREGLKLPTAPHVERALESLFAAKPSLILDGELYNHDLHDDFNTISSVLKKQTPSIADLLRSEELVQYHLYDLPSHTGTFSARSKALQELVTQAVLTATGNSTPLVLVETVAGAKADAIDYLNKFLGLGYEGAIARRDHEYQNKRSKGLLKIKKFLDEEFQLLRIETGRGSRSDIAARAVLQLKDGREFEAGIIGDHPYCKKWEECTCISISQNWP